MRLKLLFLCACALFMACSAESSAPSAPAPESAVDLPRPDKLGLCVACHGEFGYSPSPGIPHLNGQDGTYLEKSLNDYRSGARKAAPMNTIANSLQAGDIQALAQWYAAQESGSGHGK